MVIPLLMDFEIRAFRRHYSSFMYELTITLISSVR